MSKILEWLENLCTAIALALAGYFYGKETVENERLEEENKKLKDGLTAAMHGDYSPDAVRDRMRGKDGD